MNKKERNEESKKNKEYVLCLIPLSRKITRTDQRQERAHAHRLQVEKGCIEAVEYVRGIPVVKTFGQSVFSFKKFKATIDEYEKWVISYTKDLRLPCLLYTSPPGADRSSLPAGAGNAGAGRLPGVICISGKAAAMRLFQRTEVSQL